MDDVTVKHDEYTEFEDVWETMRDHLSGSRKIKEAGVKYLPMLGEPSNKTDVSDYEAYKMRALYYEATKRTQQAMLGAITMKPATYTNLDDKYQEQFKQVTLDGYSMDTFQRNVLSELIGVSRVGVLLERAKADQGGHMYFSQYKAEEIINWRFERVNDEIVLTLVVLMETYEQEDGRFATEERTRYRALELVDGIYVQSVFEAQTQEDKTVVYLQSEEVVPVNVGQPLDYIPFVFFTPMGNVPTVAEPTLCSVATINESHYRTSADLEHGRHFTGLPTAWVAGFDEETELKIGSQVAWVSNNPQAKAGFLEFTGTGLGALVTALIEKQEQMATMGARMLRPPKTGVEAAETARIYQSAESGTLAGLAKAASESFTTLLQYWLDWQGLENPDVMVDLNTDYVDTRIDAGMLTALMNTFLAGGISYDTLFYNLQMGELIPDGTDSETELDLIATQRPDLGSTEPETGE